MPVVFIRFELLHQTLSKTEQMVSEWKRFGIKLEKIAVKMCRAFGLESMSVQHGSPIISIH